MRRLRVIVCLAGLLAAVSAASAVSASRPVRNNNKIAYAIGKVMAGGSFKHGQNMSVYVSPRNRKKNPSQLLTDCAGALASGRPVPDLAVFRFEPRQVKFMPCRPNKAGGYKSDLDARNQIIDGRIKLLSPALQLYYAGKKAEALQVACRLLSASCRYLLAVEAGPGGSFLEYNCLGNRSRHRTHYLVLAGKSGSRRISCHSHIHPPRFMLPKNHSVPSASVPAPVQQVEAPAPALPVATPAPTPLPPWHTGDVGDVKVVVTLPNAVMGAPFLSDINFHISCGSGTDIMDAVYKVTLTASDAVQKLAVCPIGSTVSVEEVLPQCISVVGENPQRQTMKDSSGVLMKFVNQVCSNFQGFPQ
jgi:hypothetical protein